METVSQLAFMSYPPSGSEPRFSGWKLQKLVLFGDRQTEAFSPLN